MKFRNLFTKWQLTNFFVIELSWIRGDKRYTKNHDVDKVINWYNNFIKTAEYKQLLIEKDMFSEDYPESWLYNKINERVSNKVKNWKKI